MSFFESNQHRGSLLVRIGRIIFSCAVRKQSFLQPAHEIEPQDFFTEKPIFFLTLFF